MESEMENKINEDNEVYSFIDSLISRHSAEILDAESETNEVSVVNNEKTEILMDHAINQNYENKILGGCNIETQRVEQCNLKILQINSDGTNSDGIEVIELPLPERKPTKKYQKTNTNRHEVFDNEVVQENLETKKSEDKNRSFLTATIGRFVVLIEKSNISQLNRINPEDFIKKGDIPNRFRKVIEIRSLLQGHVWRDFPSVKSGYFISLVGQDWSLYLDSVKDFTILSNEEVRLSRLSKKHLWVKGVVMDPLRICINPELLIEHIRLNQSNSIKIRWHD